MSLAIDVSSSESPQESLSSTSDSTPSLFRPFTLGDLTLQHRIVLAPLTRLKADNTTHVQLPLVKEYYAQRSCEPGTLLIAEAAVMAQRAGMNWNVPGIYTPEQIFEWRKITDVVHANKCFIFSQLWAHGRAANIDVSRADNPSWSYVSSSPVRLSTQDETPRALTIPEIKEYVSSYGDAAAASVDGAGFDGIELHFANGYLVDQFLQDVCNQRTDEYGGSIENRTRFALEIIDEIVSRIGPKKVGMRVSPWSPFQDMRMEDPKPTFSYLVTQIKEKHPDLAFIHLIEPRISGYTTIEISGQDESNDFIRDIWAPRPIISAGNYKRDSAIETCEKKGDLIAFGRLFISNPDLVRRLKENIALNPYDRSTFYVPGDQSGRGYTDYPFAN